MSDHDVIAYFDDKQRAPLVAGVRCWITDKLTQHPAARLKNIRQSRRQVLKLDGGRQQCIEAAFESPARAVRNRDLADLTRDQLETAAVEGTAERDRDLLGAVPAQLQYRCLHACEVERGHKAGTCPTCVHDKIAIAWCSKWGGEADAKPAREFAAGRFDIHQCHLSTGHLRA